MPLKRLEFAGNVREIENTLKIQRVVGVDVDMEKGFFVVGEYLFVESVILLRRALGSRLQPKRCSVVQRCFFGRFFTNLAKEDLDWHKGAVFVQNAFELKGVEIFFLVGGKVHYDGRSATIWAHTRLDLIFLGI